MSTPIDATRTATDGLNKLAVTAIVLAVIAASGFWVFGVAVLAVFAVGAGHVALNQIHLGDERGKGLAIAAPAVGYGIAAGFDQHFGFHPERGPAAVAVIVFGGGSS